MEKITKLNLAGENLKKNRHTLCQNKLDNGKIESPLAKYDACGNIICIICRSIIKSAVLWKVHVNSKQHKLKVEAAKLLSRKPKPTETSVKQSNNIPIKQKKDTNNSFELSENAQNLTNNDFRMVLTKNDSNDDSLPKTFFDDPVNAKTANGEYKNSQDEEWEKFQREIKEESSTSNAIIAGEQLESTVSRQIAEIDEQIERWAKVRILEQKMENIIKNSQITKNPNTSAGISSDEDEEKSFEEFSNWRSKKF